MELIAVRNERDVAILQPTMKRLGASVALSFKQAVVQVIGSGSNKLVMDLEKVEFMDSSGLGAMVSILKELGARGTMAVCNVKGGVLSLFKLTRMDKVFAIVATPTEAIDKLAA